MAADLNLMRILWSKASLNIGKVHEFQEQIINVQLNPKVSAMGQALKALDERISLYIKFQLSSIVAHRGSHIETTSWKL